MYLYEGLRPDVKAEGAVVAKQNKIIENMPPSNLTQMGKRLKSKLLEENAKHSFFILPI